MNAMEEYAKWMESSLLDGKSREELASIKDDRSEIEERFYRELEFGTAGLRGIIGAGTNRMNRYTVRKATQGLANYIIAMGAADKGVVIAFDSRHMSPEFAEESALTLAANGVKAYLFESLRPTPELSFAVRYLGCTAGINITASHNPSNYNGYKVYWADGAQITPPHDKGIMAEVNKIEDIFSAKTMDRKAAGEAGLLTVIGKDVDDAYNEAIKKQVLHPELIKKYGKELKIIYTPLHGTGNLPVRRVLSELGFENVTVVKEQELPDGDFPTVAYPNPEAEEAFDLGLALARQTDADLVLATDPDADRLGVRVKDKNGVYHTLTGNMSGALLADYEVGQKKALGLCPDDGAMISTIVSTNMAAAVAKSYGVRFIEVLTGFKYIGQQILGFEESGKGTYLFGFEESYGCLIGTYARDKDAVSASMALCEAAAFYRDRGMTLWDAMTALYEKLGYYLEDVVSVTMAGKAGIERIGEIMEELRANPPKNFGSLSVTALRDYKKDEITDFASGAVRSTGLPSSDVLYFELEDDAWVAVRPSGTEPKIKFYCGVRGSSAADAEEKLALLKAELKSLDK